MKNKITKYMLILTIGLALTIFAYFITRHAWINFGINRINEGFGKGISGIVLGSKYFLVNQSPFINKDKVIVKLFPDQEPLTQMVLLEVLLEINSDCLSDLSYDLWVSGDLDQKSRRSLWFYNLTEPKYK